MAVEIKLAPDEKLELVRAQITDTTLNSDYFNVTELSDTFSGGKNAFLIAGSELLEPNTEVKVQIRDSAGKVLYCEFSDGSPDEYYEGISKVVAVYVYPTETTFGPATIILVGQVKDTLEIVKWQRTINIDPSLPNTTRVRFYKRPVVSIVEQLAPIYSFDITGSKVASNITQSFANIKVSQLDTFAGDVKRVKVYRTSEGDISDYDLIQDILVESKELLTTTTLSGSVVGDAGLFTSETLKKLWNTGSLTTALTSSRIDNGLSLKGSGNLKYTGSLNLTNGNTYELGMDAFYSASTASNMGIYISGSQNGAKLIGTLNGIVPTKNLKDQIFAFTLDKAEPTASLYLSQSQSEWHVGNISLKLSEDSAFSPSEISFVTSMPTVIGNETYNFKFEFYDVNNNYVPVAVTQSALFSGGNNNIGGTLVFISSSVTELSQSVSGTIGIVTGSVSQSFVTSSAYSASLQSSSLYISASVSGTISNVSQSVSGTISLVSQSLSSSISSISSSTATNFTDVNSRIFTDATGLVNKAPSNGVAGLYLGQSYLGYHNGNGNVNGWKTYMANNGNFFLTSSNAAGGYMAWDSTAATLVIKGAITVTGGDAATQTYAAGQKDLAIASGSAAASAAQSAAISQASAYVTSLANGGWTAGNGTFITSTQISSPTIAGNAGYISGLFKVGSGGITLDGGNKKIYIGGDGTTGYFNNANTAFYVDNNSNFSLGNKLVWNGTTLTIDGSANIGGSTATVLAAGAAAGAAALQPGANITSLSNNAGYQNNSSDKTAGSVGGWTINSTNLTSNNNRTVLYNTGYIELKDASGQNKITIDSGPTLPSPTSGSDSGNIVVPAQTAQTAIISGGTITGGNSTSPLIGPDANGFYGIGWSQQVWFTPTISGYYEFTTWFPKNDGMGASGTSGTAIMGLRAYIYDAAGNSLVNEEGREYIEGPVEGAAANVTRTGFAAGTYGNQYNRGGTGAYFSNQYLQAGVAVRFLIQWIVFNIRNTDDLTIKAYWPATNVQYISNVPKTNINQQGFQVIQDTNRYLTIRPSGWYMYNDPAVYGGSPPPNLGDQGVTEVTGIMGGTMVVLNATDKNDWHSGKQKSYIRSAQFSYANRAAGGNFITSFFYGGYARSFNITRAYGWFSPNTNTGFSLYEDQWWPYAYNIESITRISYGKFQVTFAEPIMDTYGAYEGGGIYSVFIGSRNMDSPTDFQQAGISNLYHTGFIMDLGNEVAANRFISILVVA